MKDGESQVLKRNFKILLVMANIGIGNSASVHNFTLQYHQHSIVKNEHRGMLLVDL